MNHSSPFPRIAVTVFVAVTPMLLVRAWAADRITLTNSIDNDEAIVLLNGCSTEKVLRVRHHLDIDNVAKGSCLSEAIVFSSSNAMFLRENLEWKNNDTDTIDIALKKPVKVDVVIWLARADAKTGPDGAETHIKKANELFDNNKVGVTFAATFEEVFSDTDAVEKIGTSCSPLNVKSERGPNVFTEGSINVYYVTKADSGVTCKPQNPDILFIGTNASPTSLAHEFGHAFSLSHEDPGTTNVMVGGSAETRTNFTDGQAFRMNVKCSSIVANDPSDLQARLSTTPEPSHSCRHCDDNTGGSSSAGSEGCPSIDLDVEHK